MKTVDKRVSDSAKYVVTAVAASNMVQRYLLLAQLEIQDLPEFSKKHQWLKNKVTELSRAHANALKKLDKAFKTEGIHLQFDNDCDRIMEEFEKIVFEPK